MRPLSITCPSKQSFTDPNSSFTHVCIYLSWTEIDFLLTDHCVDKLILFFDSTINVNLHAALFSTISSIATLSPDLRFKNAIVFPICCVTVVSPIAAYLLLYPLFLSMPCRPFTIHRQAHYNIHPYIQPVSHSSCTIHIGFRLALWPVACRLSKRMSCDNVCKHSQRLSTTIGGRNLNSLKSTTQRKLLLFHHAFFLLFIVFQPLIDTPRHVIHHDISNSSLSCAVFSNLPCASVISYFISIRSVLIDTENLGTSIW